MQFSIASIMFLAALAPVRVASDVLGQHGSGGPRLLWCMNQGFDYDAQSKGAVGTACVLSPRCSVKTFDWIAHSRENGLNSKHLTAKYCCCPDVESAWDFASHCPDQKAEPKPDGYSGDCVV